MYEFRSSRFTNQQPFKKEKEDEFNPVECLNKLLEYGRGNSSEKLSEKDILEICHRSSYPFCDNRNLIYLYAPFKIMGMVQGHFKDLIKIFDIYGFPDQTNYIFLGGYINKGEQSIQTLCLLLLYKMMYPTTVHLLRGCDQSEKMTKIFGFQQQCQENYGLNVWRQFCLIFSSFPVAALIQGKILCLHAGLSPDLLELNDIDKIDSLDDPGEEGFMCDLLWSDFCVNMHGFEKNPRGLSYKFGRDVVEKFLYVNNLDMLVCSHQIVKEGYEFSCDKKMLTLCGAPNYLGKYDNNAAMLVVSQGLKCFIEVYTPKARADNSQ